MTRIALIDGDVGKRTGKGANKYTAYTYVTDTEKRCSFCLEIKPHDSFHKDKKNIYGKGLAYYCKLCANQKAREHTERHAHKVEYKQAKRNSYYLIKHNITLEEFHQRLEKQQYQCAICSITLQPGGSFTHMDHNHNTGELRGVLCTNCNRGLGHFKDDSSILLAAVSYLNSHTVDGKQKEGRSL